MWLLSGFLFVDRPTALSLLSRWKPQPVVGQVLSEARLNRYLKARLALEGECTGALMAPNDDFHVFVSQENVTKILASISRHDTVDAAALCTWHEETFLDHVLAWDDDDEAHKK